MPTTKTLELRPQESNFPKTTSAARLDVEEFVSHLARLIAKAHLRRSASEFPAAMVVAPAKEKGR